jgi:hypothetical protein
MTHRALHSGARVVEIPITFHERTAGHSKMSPAIVLEALLVVTRLAFTEDRSTPARELVQR